MTSTSMCSRAQSLVKATIYHTISFELQPELPEDDYPGAAWHWYFRGFEAALRHAGDCAEVIRAIQSDPAVMAAAKRTRRLLKDNDPNFPLLLVGFGPGWRDTGKVEVW